MTAIPRDQRTGVNLVWFAALVVALGGYVFAFRLIETRIDERVARIAHSSEQLRADDRVLAEQPRLVVERAHLRARLARVEIGDDATRLVARFLHDAARIAARHRTSITAIAGSSAGAAAARTPLSDSFVRSSTPPATVVDPFQVIPFDVTIEGRYGDLLATVVELSATPVLARIDLVSLGRKNVDAPDATLSAALHVALERVAPPIPLSTPSPEVLDVRTRPQ